MQPSEIIRRLWVLPPLIFTAIVLLADRLLRPLGVVRLFRRTKDDLALAVAVKSYSRSGQRRELW